MTIEEELEHFEQSCDLLSNFIGELATVKAEEITQEHFFLAEAVTFRLFRNYERFVRAVFLDFCVIETTASGQPVDAKLKCPDWDTAEEILKSGNKFLEWGNVSSIRNLSNLVFRDGFPLVDLVGPIASTLTDLHRLRNFIAHDSKEAENGFKKSIQQYVSTGHDSPSSVGELALYRRRSRDDITLKIIHTKVLSLEAIYREL